MATPSDGQYAWVSRVLGIALPNRTPNSRAGDGPMAAWHSARTGAISSLKQLENAFRGMDDPRADPAIILLRSIAANLTAEPTTPAQLQELIAYLRTDPIIEEAEMENGFGITVELRKPLLAALAGLLKQHVRERAQP